MNRFAKSVIDDILWYIRTNSLSKISFTYCIVSLDCISSKSSIISLRTKTKYVCGPTIVYNSKLPKKLYFSSNSLDKYSLNNSKSYSIINNWRHSSKREYM